MVTVRYTYDSANPPKQRARLAELRDLAEKGRMSGISDEDGETVFDRLEAKYNALIQSSTAGCPRLSGSLETIGTGR